MNFKEFQILIPRDVDIRPLLPEVVRMYTKGNEKAHRSPYGPDGFVIIRAEKDSGYWKPDQRRTQNTSRTGQAEFGIRDYTKIVDAWKRKDRSKRGDKARAAAVLFWFFKYVDEPIFFMKVATSVWDIGSEKFKRLAYAKLGDPERKDPSGISQRYTAQLEDVEREYVKLDLSPFIETQKFRSVTESIILEDCWKSRNKFHFSNAISNYKDRDGELQRVLSLIEAHSGFGWIQFSGPAGSGKTRLAAEIADSLRKDWNAGFLTTRNLRKFAKDADSWQPKSPQLLVLDYVIPRAADIAELFQYLISRSQDFEFPVVVIILERQPWNLKKDVGTTANPSAVFMDKFKEKLRASWFLDLHRDPDAHQLTSPDILVGDGLLQLHDFELPNAIELIEEQAGNDALSEAGESIVAKFLIKNELLGRPLYLLFVADSIADGSFDKSWNRTDLLSNVLQREERKIWLSLPETKSPFEIIRSEAVELACVFTVVSGIDASEIGSLWPGIFEFHAEAVSAALEITGTESWENGNISRFEPLEPNLLGEWFVLQELAFHRHASKIVLRCWSLKQDAVRSFLIRSMDDFPDHPSINLFLENVPNGKNYLELIEEIALQAFRSAVNHDAPLPVGAYLRLAKSNHSECVLASAYCRIHRVNILAMDEHKKGTRNMSIDRVHKGPVDWFVEGFMYERGWSVQKSVARAFECYEHAVKEGHPLSAICQHFALHGNRIKYQLAGDAEELLEQGTTAILSAVDSIIEGSGQSGSNRLAAERKTVSEYASSFLYDASQFFLQMAVNNQRNSEFSEQYFDNAQVFMQMSNLLREDPSGDLDGTEITALAAKLMFDAAYFFDSLSHNFESAANGEAIGMGLRSDTLGWSMMENACVYSIFGFMLKRDPNELTYGVPPLIWKLTLPQSTCQ